MAGNMEAKSVADREWFTLYVWPTKYFKYILGLLQDF